MSQVEAAALAGNERARLAIEIFADRVREAIGAMAVHLGGVDALVFTGRIGYGSSVLRSLACEGLECLGVELDPERNTNCEPDAEIAAKNSPARILVIRPNEEQVVARETRRLTRMF